MSVTVCIYLSSRSSKHFYDENIINFLTPNSGVLVEKSYENELRGRKVYLFYYKNAFHLYLSSVVWSSDLHILCIYIIKMSLFFAYRTLFYHKYGKYPSFILKIPFSETCSKQHD